MFKTEDIARNNTPENIKNIFKNIDFNIKSIIEFGNVS